MYKIINKYFTHTDSRGSIEGIINTGNWQEINYIKTAKGCIRGGHFHKKTKELFFIIEGKIKATLEADNIKEEKIFRQGDIFLINPLTIHTFEALEDCKWINMLSDKHTPESPDIFKKDALEY